MSLQDTSVSISAIGRESGVQLLERDSPSFAAGQQVTSYHPDDVEALLSDAPELYDAAVSVLREVCRWFPDSDGYRLAVTREPDMPTERYLVVEVLTSLDPSAAVERLAEFDRQWLIAQSRDITTRLIVDVAPR